MRDRTSFVAVMRGLLAIAALMAWVGSAAADPGPGRGRERREDHGEREEGEDEHVFDRRVPAPRIDGDSPRRIQAGDSVVIRWEGLPAGVEEMEVLLSIDGGRTFPIRISPQLEGAAAWFSWRVPNLPAREARLRVRASLSEREREREGPPSESFEIMANHGAPIDVPFQEGFTSERHESSPPPLHTEANARPPSWSEGRRTPALGPGSLGSPSDKLHADPRHLVATDVARSMAPHGPSAVRAPRIALRI